MPVAAGRRGPRAAGALAGGALTRAARRPRPAQVRALVEENERLHADARRAAEQLEGRAMAAAACMVAGQGSDAERARLQVGAQGRAGLDRSAGG